MLHISCHGIRKKVKKYKMTISNSRSAAAEQEFEGHYLLFENHFGDGDLVSAHELSQFMSSLRGESFALVFVAACDSENVGKIFQVNGAQHVVCVENRRLVLDDAAIHFTKTFYDQLFTKEEQVCTAFQQA